jgi:single-strand DNA-binding protein
VNKVLLTGRLTRDPELRSLASGSSVATFAVATSEYRGAGKEHAEFHNVVVWDRLAVVCGQYLGKGQQVAIEGRLQTRQWDDDRGTRHWKTEVVATSVEMLSGRRKKDYQADALATQAAAETTTDESAISPNEAAEVGVRTVPDEAADEQPSDDEEVLVLA